MDILSCYLAIQGKIADGNEAGGSSQQLKSQRRILGLSAHNVTTVYVRPEDPPRIISQITLADSGVERLGCLPVPNLYSQG